MLKNILITLDGSELSEKALAYAPELIGAEGTITLLTVVDLPDVSAYSLYPVQVSMDYYNEALTLAEKGAVEYIQKAAESLRNKGYKVDTVVETGVAAEAIVALAKKINADAIVISTHGRTGLNQWLFGSITQRVLSSMPCPVFVVPGWVTTQKQPAEQESATAD